MERCCKIELNRHPDLRTSRSVTRLGTVPFEFVRTGARHGQAHFGGSDDDKVLDRQRVIAPSHRSVAGDFGNTRCVTSWRQETGTVDGRSE